VLRVEAKATTSAAAVQAAREAASQLQAKVTSLGGQERSKLTLARYARISREVAAQQSRVNSSGGHGPEYIDAASQLALLQAQQSALNAIYQDQAKGAANSGLNLLGQAAPTGDDAKSRKQIDTLAGFGAGALLAYVISRLLPSRSRDDDRPAFVPAPAVSSPREPVAVPAPSDQPAADPVISVDDPPPVLLPQQDRPRVRLRPGSEEPPTPKTGQAIPTWRRDWP
jgi:hypothetical protein